MNTDTLHSLTTALDLLVGERDRIDSAIGAIRAVLGASPPTPAIEHACTAAEVEVRFHGEPSPASLDRPGEPEAPPKRKAPKPNGKSKLARIAAFVEARGATRAADVAAKVEGVDVRNAGIALSHLHQTGKIKRVGVGTYAPLGYVAEATESDVAVDTPAQRVLDFVVRDGGQVTADGVALVFGDIDAEQAAIILRTLHRRGLLRLVSSGVYVGPSEV